MVRTAPAATPVTLPPVAHQVEQLIDLGVPALARRSDEEFRMLTHPFDVDTAESGTALVVVHPSLVPASALASLLRLNDKAGFVVVDMVDVDGFVPIGSITVPDTPLYLVRDLDRGDDLSNWSPDEALPELERRGRRPLTVSEGISWLLQSPGTLEPNRCFMTIGSRKSKGTGFDSRVPAIWISRGTGRDGADSNGAPKVGWCWAGNRHTWLGIASAAAS